MIFTLAACGEGEMPKVTETTTSKAADTSATESSTVETTTEDTQQTEIVSLAPFPSIDGIDDSDVPDILKKVVGTLEYAMYTDYAAYTNFEYDPKKGIQLRYINVTEEDYQTLTEHYKSETSGSKVLDSFEDTYTQAGMEFTVTFGTLKAFYCKDLFNEGEYFILVNAVFDK